MEGLPILMSEDEVTTNPSRKAFSETCPLKAQIFSCTITTYYCSLLYCIRFLFSQSFNRFFISRDHKSKFGGQYCRPSGKLTMLSKHCFNKISQSSLFELNQTKRRLCTQKSADESNSFGFLSSQHKST